MAGRSNAALKPTSLPDEPLAVARPFLPPAMEILPYLERIDAARWYSNFGPLLSAFESRLSARFTDGAQVITCVNATQGLTLALQALALPRGAYCAVPAYTFPATAHAVIQAGLIPWFVDVDERSWMLTPEILAQALPTAPGPVSAVIPVAAFGAMVDLDAWSQFRATSGLEVVVDGAAAFDQVIAAPVPVVVSLHATKILGVGEGGFVATRDAGLAEAIRRLTAFGFSGDRQPLMPATNAKLSEYAAAVGLAALDAWPRNRLRWLRAGQLMRAGLMHLPQVTFQPGWGVDWAGSVCCVGLPDGRLEHVEAVAAAHGVQTRRWWNDGCHLAPAFAGLPSSDLAVTNRLAGSVVGLPYAIDLDERDINRIARALGQALAG